MNQANLANLYYLVAGLFFAAGGVNFFGDESASGATFVAVGATFLAVGASQRKESQTAVKPVELSESQRLEVQALASEGKKIEAVKRVRKETGAGLRAAKDYVDGLETHTN